MADEKPLMNKDKIKEMLATLSPTQLASITVTASNGQKISLAAFLSDESKEQQQTTISPQKRSAEIKTPLDQATNGQHLLLTKSPTHKAAKSMILESKTSTGQTAVRRSSSIPSIEIWGVNDTDMEPFEPPKTPTKTPQRPKAPLKTPPTTSPKQVAHEEEQVPESDDEEDNSNYSGDIVPYTLPVQKSDFPANAGYFLDEVMNITEIKLYRGKFVCIYGNTVYSEVTQPILIRIIHYGRAAPSFKLTSMYTDMSMHPKTLDSLFYDINAPAFWENCNEIQITGNWNAVVLRQFTESFPSTIYNFTMRRFMVTFSQASKSLYRTEYAIANLTSLWHLNFDCRNTESPNATASINAVSKVMLGKPLRHLFLNVRGWYYNYNDFKKAFDVIKSMTEIDATITVLTDRGLDKEISGMLQRGGFEYVGQGQCEAENTPYDIHNYELFRCKKRPNFTYGCLKHEFTEVEIKDDWKWN